MRTIIVHTLEQATAAMAAADECNLPVILQSAPDAVFYAGSLYLLTMFKQAQRQFPQVPARFILDCAECATTAMQAMEAGHRHIKTVAPDEARRKLADIAEQNGITCVSESSESLDLLHLPNAQAACKNWLMAHANG